MKTFIIAEAASCHDGHLDQALALIRTAKDVGADAVKFQWVSSAGRLCERRNAPTYLDAYRLIEFPQHWLPRLSDEASACDIELMCTAFLPEDIEVVAPYVSRFKVSSFEATDLTFLRAHERFHKPVIVSTGMMKRRPTHVHGDMEVWWLHCVSAYPTPLDEANLRVLHTGEFDGFSDHTTHLFSGALAAAAGAKIIEFHLRLDDTNPSNADYAVSRDPLQARMYIGNIRFAEIALGDGIKCVQPSEQPMTTYRVMA